MAEVEPSGTFMTGTGSEEDEKAKRLAALKSAVDPEEAMKTPGEALLGSMMGDALAQVVQDAAQQEAARKKQTGVEEGSEEHWRSRQARRGGLSESAGRKGPGPARGGRVGVARVPARWVVPRPGPRCESAPRLQRAPPPLAALSQEPRHEEAGAGGLQEVADTGSIGGLDRVVKSIFIWP